MSRLSITLNDDLHRSLKETATRQGRTIRSIIEESLELRGIRSIASARDLVHKARIHADLDEDEALAISIEETRSARVE